MRQLAGFGTALGRARDAKRETGKPVLRQLAEMLRLRLQHGKLMPDEYFGFGLYDDRRFDGEARRQFVGQWAKDAIYRRNERKWRAIGDDKLIAHLVFAGLGLPQPKVLAVHHPHRQFPARLLRTPEELKVWLRSDAPYPLFAKPSGGGSASSAYLLDGYEAGGDAMRLGDGRSVPIEDFVRDCVRWKAGMIFQELVLPDADVAAVCGPRVATARLYVLNGSPGATLHRAVLRVPTGRNMYDNFRGGASGNLLAALDDDGRIVRVVRQRDGKLGEVDRHPDTGRPLVGWQVPGWDGLVATCLEAAAAFPGLRVQAWDVAIAAGGPQFIEMNTRGDLDLIQLAHGRGIIDARWQATFPDQGAGA